MAYHWHCFCKIRLKLILFQSAGTLYLQIGTREYPKFNSEATLFSSLSPSVSTFIFALINELMQQSLLDCKSGRIGRVTYQPVPPSRGTKSKTFHLPEQDDDPEGDPQGTPETLVCLFVCNRACNGGHPKH